MGYTQWHDIVQDCSVVYDYQCCPLSAVLYQDCLVCLQAGDSPCGCGAEGQLDYAAQAAFENYLCYLVDKNQGKGVNAALEAVVPADIKAAATAAYDKVKGYFGGAK